MAASHGRLDDGPDAVIISIGEETFYFFLVTIVADQSVASHFFCSRNCLSYFFCNSVGL
jgi:hypothetical protein